MRAIRRVVSVATMALVLVVSAMGLAVVGAPAVGAATDSNAVATTTLTFVDTSRPTPPWDGKPAEPSRTLVTSVWYPARAAGSGPYPLIVFAHGLGASPQDYQRLLTAWAAAGYVVAAPLFPLSSSETPGGPDGGDIGNQPGDMSFVIDQVLKASAAANGPLSGLVDPHEVGAAGHSNGAITTLGLVANSCCRDARIKAAVVMAGTTEGLGHGTYELAKAPPLLVVSDVHDGLVPYADALAVFNQARTEGAACAQLGHFLRQHGFDGAHGRLWCGWRHIRCGHQVNNSLLQCLPQACTRGFTGRRRQRSIPSVGGAHRLDFGLPSNIASPEASGGPPPRRGHPNVRLAERPGRHRSMEWLYAWQGRQHSRVFPRGDLHGQLGRL